MPKAEASLPSARERRLSFATPIIESSMPSRSCRRRSCCFFRKGVREAFGFFGEARIEALSPRTLWPLSCPCAFPCPCSWCWAAAARSRPFEAGVLGEEEERFAFSRGAFSFLGLVISWGRSRAVPPGIFEGAYLAAFHPARKRKANFFKRPAFRRPGRRRPAPHPERQGRRLPPGPRTGSSAVRCARRNPPATRNSSRPNRPNCSIPRRRFRG